MADDTNPETRQEFPADLERLDAIIRNYEEGADLSELSGERVTYDSLKVLRQQMESRMIDGS